tara:strand:- start:1999 stop:2952 length:954 start_codon:yes stop_codon:yes gene_type:complete
MHHLSAISDYNYLTYGLLLRDSIFEHATEDFIIHYLALDEQTKTALTEVPNIKVYGMDCIEKDEMFASLKKNNPSKPGDLSPFHWALASFFTHYLIETEKLPHCLYTDTDILFYNNIKHIFDEVNAYDVGLITHKHVPLDYMQSVGYYNVGIVYFSDSKQAKKCLEFWRDVVSDKDNPYAEKFGTCGDQKYLELFSFIVDGVKINILDHEIGHAAPWNFSLSAITNNRLTWDMGPAFFNCHVTGEHEITQDLMFVHFSHFTPDYKNDSYEIDFNFEDTPKGKRPAWGNILPQPGVKDIYDNYFERCKKTRNKYGIII